MTKWGTDGKQCCWCIHYGFNTRSFSESDCCHFGDSDHFLHKLDPRHPACGYFESFKDVGEDAPNGREQ